MGKATFGCLGRKVSTFLDYTDVGSGFVFGYLVDQVIITVFVAILILIIVVIINRIMNITDITILISISIPLFALLTITFNAQKPIRTWAVNGTALDVAEQFNGNFHFVFFFKVLSIIYFFNFFISMLFYLGAMQWLVVKLGWLLQVEFFPEQCRAVI